MTCKRSLPQFQAILAAVAWLLSAHLAAAQQLSTTRLTAGIHVITAEVAADEPARMRGLMFRKELAPNHGMLFTYARPGVHCMWMRNTFIPLSVAFLDADGTIINIADMQPHDETSHCSARPASYALEMTQGWFTQRGIKPDMKLGKLPSAQ